MIKPSIMISGAFSAILLCGCAHTVPGLTAKSSKTYDSAPTVEAVVNHITCELQQADAAHGGQLAREKYLISITLLLQVDDAIGSTPSVTYTEGLKPPSTSLVTTLGLDFNAQRRRTFTTTYVVEAEKFASSPLKECAPGDTSALKQRIHRLDGDLKLGEIVGSGLAAKSLGGGILMAPKDKDDKRGPTFGSQVQFVVTSAVTGLGPTWTLRYWKGPSSLFNGKAVYTNSASLGFAPQFIPAAQPNATGIAEQKIQEAQKSLDQARQALAVAKSKALKNVGPREGKTLEFQFQAFGVPDLEQQVQDARDRLGDARAELNQARTEDARQTASGRDAAAAASRDMLNTILLQNLPTSR